MNKGDSLLPKMREISVNEFSQYTLLIVEDEEMLRDVIVFDFKRKGFQVLSEENGVEAFKLVKANKVHLVLSDMRMPGGDGMTLLEQVRAYDTKIPALIFVTGYSDFSVLHA